MILLKNALFQICIIIFLQKFAYQTLNYSYRFLYFISNSVRKVLKGLFSPLKMYPFSFMTSKSIILREKVMVITSRLESGPSPYKLFRSVFAARSRCLLDFVLCGIQGIKRAPLCWPVRVGDSNGRRSVSRLLRGSYVNMETGSWNPVFDSTYDSNQRGQIAASFLSYSLAPTQERTRYTFATNIVLSFTRILQLTKYSPIHLMVSYPASYPASQHRESKVQSSPRFQSNLYLQQK